MPLSPPYFDSLFATSDDPWGFRTRWYEQRKPYGGDAVHETLANETGLPRVVHHQEDDFVLDVWTREGQSVRRAEGLS
jgi:hypothetical protein